MLDNKGFDLWADGYDKAVGLSEGADSFPFAGYKNVLGGIFQEIMTTENAKVLDIGFGTGTLATKLYENGCEIFGQDFSQRMIELAGEKMPNAKLYKGDIADGLVEPLREKLGYRVRLHLDAIAARSDKFYSKELESMKAAGVIAERKEPL